MDYLLKPIDGARFQAALARVRDRICGQTLVALAARLEQLISTLKGEKKIS